MTIVKTSELTFFLLTCRYYRQLIGSWLLTQLTKSVKSTVRTWYFSSKSKLSWKKETPNILTTPGFVGGVAWWTLKRRFFNWAPKLTSDQKRFFLPIQSLADRHHYWFGVRTRWHLHVHPSVLWTIQLSIFWYKNLRNVNNINLLFWYKSVICPKARTRKSLKTT